MPRWPAVATEKKQSRRVWRRASRGKDRGWIFLKQNDTYFLNRGSMTVRGYIARHIIIAQNYNKHTVQ
jgi:hypothetical protein